jgi:hypothetical protein
MALFIELNTVDDRHSLDAVARIHDLSDETNLEPGTRCLRHWVSFESRTLFCLIEANDRSTASNVHSDISGLTASQCYAVSEHL